jgi:hypothetical protein
MNTKHLKRFAKEARIKLLDQIGRKLEFVLTHDTAELRGKEKEIAQLNNKIQHEGKNQVIEMVAYTWFNRLMALRFMDANGYTVPKVITPLPSMTNPEILQNALGGNTEPDLQLDRQRLNDLLDGKTASADAHTEAYKMLLVASCNQWHTAMPFMFERISDYTELLLPDDLLSDYSIVADICNGMSEEDCQQEELIGWLYQFYISDKKDDVFDALKRNIKITPENIPAATQLFTPRWIVRYMVKNTLGKLWLTSRPNSKLRTHMSYYIETPEDNVPAPLPEDIKSVNDITFLDPCLGSGHVLVYAFDLFAKIYEEEGYNTNEIPALILQHNLFGIDIDERAAQLAAFALTMKARSYYSRFLRKPVQPHVIALENVSEDIIKQAIRLPLLVAGKLVYDHRDLSLYNLTEVDNFGSLIQIDPEELEALVIQKGSLWQEQEKKLKEQSEYLSRQYHCVVTNPPYMGGKGINDALKEFLEENYNEGKSDTFAAFILRCQNLVRGNGFQGMITMESWMFLSSFEVLRAKLLDDISFCSLIHMPYLGKGGTSLGINFGTSAFVFQNAEINNKGVYQCIRYFETDDLGVPTNFPTLNERFNTIRQKDFEKIPGCSIGYWMSEKALKVFDSKSLSFYAEPRLGMATADNSLFVRFFWEVSANKRSTEIDSRIKAIESGLKWFIYAKGGDFRRWYGNNEYVVNWYDDGQEIKSFADNNGKIRSHNYNLEYIFRDGITWNALTSAKTSFRVLKNALFDNAGSSLFPFSNENYFYIFGVLNSRIIEFLIPVINPTLNYQPGTIGKLPMLISNKEQIEKSVKVCIDLSKSEQELIETAIDFKTNILLMFNETLISSATNKVELHVNKARTTLKENETIINDLVITSYGLNEELSSDVNNGDISIFSDFYQSEKVNREKLFYNFLSYSVGVMFGRFSVNNPGFILANQGETLKDFLAQVSSPTFIPDDDNIIPVLDGEWFADDIVSRFKLLLKASFGNEHFEANLNFIEDTIGKDIRKYFMRDFYGDHIKRYKKRPIYWMFSSAKGHFKALVYMHRYQPDLCSKLLNDYLQNFISKLEAKKQNETRLSLREDISVREKTLAIKEIDKLETILKDCQEYEKILFAIATQKISIDLDDGVKVNYQKFKDVLVPIKGLEKEEEE